MSHSTREMILWSCYPLLITLVSKIWVVFVIKSIWFDILCNLAKNLWGKRERISACFFAAFNNSKFSFSWLYKTYSGYLLFLSYASSIFYYPSFWWSFFVIISCWLFGTTFFRLFITVLSLGAMFSLRLSKKPVFHTLMILSDPPEMK